jgi:hypothetical protein
MFDVITIQESWLSSNNEILANLNNYEIICKHKLGKSQAGGGLCTFVRSNLMFSIRSDLKFKNDKNCMYDCLFVKMGKLLLYVILIVARVKTLLMHIVTT